MQWDMMLENMGLRDVNPLVCGRQECEPGYTFGPAAREYYLLHYVQRGMGVLENGRGVHKVRAGQVFVIRPGEVTRYSADQATPWHYIWVGFATSLPVQALLGKDVLPAPGLGPLFQEMLACGESAAAEWRLCAKVYEVLAALADTAEEGQAGGTARENERRVNMAVNYIKTNYARGITVAEIAANLSLDRSYFSRIFKGQTGKSPQAYLIDYRLAKAAQLLVENQLRPGEAARQAGYDDIVNFTRMFRRRYGTPPGSYAKNAK